MSPAERHPSRHGADHNEVEPVELARNDLRLALQHALSARDAEPNPGLLLHKGLTRASKDDKTAKSQLIRALAGHSSSGFYERAYHRWKQATQNPPSRFASVIATVQGRLYIGTERSNALETGITTHHSYGVPLIPGSAVKGNCRAHAQDIGLQATYDRWFFGKPIEREDPAEPDQGGHIVFHDAWWEPDSGPAKNAQCPFAPEIVTPHHSGYYSGKQPEATDFDSPVPAPQIATHGSFRFLLECTEPGAAATAWLAVAIDLLKDTLQQHGLGGKGSSGYGYFTVMKP